MYPKRTQHKRTEAININEIKGYEYITDSTGQRLAIERSTGEVRQSTVIEAPIGTIFYTPEQQTAYRERKQREAERSFSRAANKPLGNYFFIPTNERFVGIAPETVTRLIYLNTFTGFESNKLMLTQRTPIYYKNLPQVLGLSKATVFRFWKEVSPRYIAETDGGLIFTNENIFRRGQIKRSAEYTRYQKIYTNGVRTLYETTAKGNHRQLGYFFKLLPYINIEYNLLCYNPTETDIEKLELLSVADFCRLIDYDVLHINKLLAIYRDVRFDADGRQERFCAITYDGINKAGAKICINPHILYCGSNYKQVEILGAFCK